MWSYRNPVDVQFGQGSFAKLGELLGARSYALVTYGEPIFRKLGAELEAQAGKPLLVVEDIAPNPDISHLEQQAARFRDLPAEPEVIVALGGGSVIDSAKVFAAARGDFGAVDAFLSMTVESGPRIFAQKEPRFWVDGGHDGERPIRRSWSGLHSLIGRGSFAFGFSFESGS